MNFNASINMYKVFFTGEKYGITTWDNQQVFAPKCTKCPDIRRLEEFGYTFIELDEGCNLIDGRGLIYLEPSVKGIKWFIQNKIVAFIGNDDRTGLFFVKERRYIYGIDDASNEKIFIATFLQGKKGLVTHSGYEIFKPAYMKVELFDNDIYVAYTDDGRPILNSQSWESPTEIAESFQLYKDGIMAKFSPTKYGWINPQNGKLINPEELTKHQHFYIEFSEKSAKYLCELKKPKHFHIEN